MSMKEWARREVELVCAGNESKENDETSNSYMNDCYKSALKAYESLCNDGHSGYSIRVTKDILNKLLDGKPLSAIEGKDDDWDVVNKEETMFQCKRMFSLFKHVENGVTTYTESNRIVYVDVKGEIWHDGDTIARVSDLIPPIEMPYTPGNRAYEVHGDDFASNGEIGVYDHKALFYIITPSGERIEVNRFYRETEDNGHQITKDEYMSAKNKALELWEEKENV